jgi:hypothetical protein
MPLYRYKFVDNSQKKINWHYPELLVAYDTEETKEKLVTAAQEIWNEIADEILAGLSDIMSNRGDAVGVAEGWYTKY